MLYSRLVLRAQKQGDSPSQRHTVTDQHHTGKYRIHRTIVAAHNHQQHRQHSGADAMRRFAPVSDTSSVEQPRSQHGATSRPGWLSTRSPGDATPARSTRASETLSPNGGPRQHKPRTPVGQPRRERVGDRRPRATASKHHHPTRSSPPTPSADAAAKTARGYRRTQKRRVSPRGRIQQTWHTAPRRGKYAVTWTKN